MCMYVCMCECVCACTHLSAGAFRGQSMRFSPELELQVVVSHLMWMLGTKLRSSGKAAMLLTTESSLQFFVKFLNDENQIKSSEMIRVFFF